MCTEVKEKEIKEAIEKEAEIEREAELQSHDQSDDQDDLDLPIKEVDRFEHQLIEQTVDVIKKESKTVDAIKKDSDEKEEIVSKDEEDEAKYEEEEKEEERTTTEEVIEEIFQVSDDGETWRTVKKITTITPSGTTEKIIELGGIAKDLL